MNIFNSEYSKNYHSDIGSIDDKLNNKGEISQLIFRIIPNSQFNYFKNLGQFSEVVIPGDYGWSDILTKMVSFLRGAGYELPVGAIIHNVEDALSLDDYDINLKIDEPTFSGLETPQIIEFVGESYIKSNSHIIDQYPNFRVVSRIYNPACFQDILDFIKSCLNQFGFIISGSFILLNESLPLTQEEENLGIKKTKSNIKKTNNATKKKTTASKDVKKKDNYYIKYSNSKLSAMILPIEGI